MKIDAYFLFHVSWMFVSLVSNMQGGSGQSRISNVHAVLMRLVCCCKDSFWTLCPSGNLLSIFINSAWIVINSQQNTSCPHFPHRLPINPCNYWTKGADAQQKKSNRGCIILGYNNNNEFCKHITSLKLIPLNIVSDIFFNLTDFEI